jgi:CRP-like cAMP-binding protein
MLDLLYQNTAKHISFTNEEADLFLSFFKVKTLKKKEFLLKEGEICKFEGFITKGLFKVFHFDEKGFEQILNFPVEDWWITDIDSFTNEIPSQYFIQALEYSEIVFINKEDKEKLYEELPKVEKLFRIMSQKRLISLQRRISENLKKNSEQRYFDFLKKYPQLSHRLTNLQIASYIGTSHELVSKIRRKISSKK